VVGQYLPIITGIGQVVLIIVGVGGGIAAWRYNEVRRRRELLELQRLDD
jgi:hypothetical protein